MDFRWVMFITLWTFLVGPIFDASGGAVPARKPAAAFPKAPKLAPATSPARRESEPPFRARARGGLTAATGSVGCGLDAPGKPGG